MSKYNRMPLNFNGITTYFSSNHLAIDLGWNVADMPVYAVNDGVVFDIGKSTGTGNAGNYVWIKWSDGSNDWYSRFAHLKDNSIKVKVGQNVSRGQQVATMGGTYGYAVHLHYDLWKCPKGYKFNWNDRTKYSVNPCNYTYVFDGQAIGSDTKGLTRVLGTSKIVSRDKNKNQIEVIGCLKCRNGAGTNQPVLGLIDYGIYDYTETKIASGYTWYKVASGWIAGTKEDTKIYPKENPAPAPTDDKDKKIKELTEQVNQLQEKIKQQEEEIAKLKSDNEKLQQENDKLNKELQNKTKYKEFKAKKDGTYYILLKENDCLYMKED